MRELEFLPANYVRARFQRRIGFIRSWLLLALGLAMVLWSLQMGVWVRDARAELQALRGTGSAVEADVEKVTMLRAEAQRYNRRLELLRAMGRKLTVTQTLGVLVNVLPEGVTLDRLDLVSSEDPEANSTTLCIRGTAANDDEVAQTLSVLETAPEFEMAILVEAKRLAGDPAGRRVFTVEANVVPALPAEEP